MIIIVERRKITPTITASIVVARLDLNDIANLNVGDKDGSKIDTGTQVLYGVEPGTKQGKGPIPAGEYKVGIRTMGPMHAEYKNRFPFHVGMLEVLDVPGFLDILIHCGNFVLDTRGCLIVGNIFRHDQLEESAVAYKRLYLSVIESAKSGKLSIKYMEPIR
jgi:hypothetical protein